MEYSDTLTIDEIRKESEIWNARCMSCGKVLGHLQARYNNFINNGYTPSQAMRELKIIRPCCRKEAMAPAKISMGLFFDHTGLQGQTSKKSTRHISKIPLSMVTDKSTHKDPSSKHVSIDKETLAVEESSVPAGSFIVYEGHDHRERIPEYPAV